MLKRLVTAAFFMFVATAIVPADISRAHRIEANQLGETDSSEVSEFLNELAVRVARDRVAPTKASRLYANVALAMFLASRDADDDMLLEMLKVPSIPSREKDIDPILAALAAGGSVARSLFLVPSARISFGESRDRLLRKLSGDLASRVVNASITYGIDIAELVVARAGDDGFEESKKIVVMDLAAPGRWIPTQPNFQSAIDPGWGTLKTFFGASKSCTLPAPPIRGTDDSPYQRAADEVAAVATQLTAEQKSIARFWDDSRGRTGTPAGHWMSLALAAADGNHFSAKETIRVVAHVLMVVADAFVVSFGQKYKYMVERPITVLQRENSEWSSYLSTPAFPEYPSGHSTVSRASADVLTLYFGKWAFTDPGYGMTIESRDKFEVFARKFTSFHDAADEASISRLYGGIHFPFGLEAGVVLGSCIARQTLRAS